MFSLFYVKFAAYDLVNILYTHGVVVAQVLVSYYQALPREGAVEAAVSDDEREEESVKMSY